MVEGYEVVTVRNIPAPLWVQVKMRAASLKMPIGAFVTYALQLALGESEPAPPVLIQRRSVPTVPSASTDTSGEDR